MIQTKSNLEQNTTKCTLIVRKANASQKRVVRGTLQTGIRYEKIADLSKVKSNEESLTRMSSKSRSECHSLIVIF